MRKKMRGQGRSRHNFRQILFTFNLDSFDRLGGTQKRQGVEERACCLGTPVPSNHNMLGFEGLALRRHNDNRATAIEEGGFDQIPIDIECLGFAVEDAQVMQASLLGKLLNKL